MSRKSCDWGRILTNDAFGSEMFWMLRIPPSFTNRFCIIYMCMKIAL